MSNIRIAAVLWVIVVFTVFATILGVILFAPPVEASRDSCECRELRRIRALLEHQLGVVCDERRCLPVPTPTNDGGNLP